MNCVLALKSYYEWKEGGGKGVWKYSGNWKPHSASKHFIRKNSDLFVNSLSKNSSIIGQDLSEMVRTLTPCICITVAVYYAEEVTSCFQFLGYLRCLALIRS